jgi:hypothetical protein
MNTSCHWVFAKGSNWFSLPEAIQQELERMFRHDRPGQIVISLFPSPVFVSSCFSYIVYIDRYGTHFGYALARVLRNAKLN